MTDRPTAAASRGRERPSAAALRAAPISLTASSPTCGTRAPTIQQSGRNLRAASPRHTAASPWHKPRSPPCRLSSPSARRADSRSTRQHASRATPLPGTERGRRPHQHHGGIAMSTSRTIDDSRPPANPAPAMTIDGKGCSLSEPLAEIAARLEEGDSLAELVETLMDARQQAPAESPLRRFLTATVTAIAWERFGIDALDHRRAVEAYRRATEETPRAPRTDGRLTLDELAALAVLAGCERKGAEEIPPAAAQRHMA
jgi:predicted small lipoprotein YifL